MENVMDKIMSFLNIKGWAGVREIYILVGAGAAAGVCLLYYFLVYQRDPRPKSITLKGHIVKILALLGAFWFLWTL